MDEEIKPVKKRPVALLVLIAVVGIGIFVGLAFLQKRMDFVDYNYTLALTAKAMNLACPYTVAENVRMDSVVAKFDKQLWQYFTITSIAREDFNDENYCKDYEDNIVDELRKTSSMSEFADHDVTLFIDLRDKNGVKLCTVDLPADKYSNRGAK
jgi:hypothetical protein